ncbi:MAG: hypothetical protein M0Z95_17845 [Actinomycetota bacterium]|nr:hypothetical protein [Actinomycetota bacterium]
MTAEANGSTRSERDGSQARPLVVYLDMNHWYALGKAMARRSASAVDADLLAKLRALRAAGAVVLPLFAIHYMELRENPRDRLTTEAADAMEELSDFWALAPTSIVLAEEIDEQLQARFGRPWTIRRSPRIGRGFGFAHGEPGHLALDGPPEAQARLRHQLGDEGVSDLIAQANAMFERAALAESRQVPCFNVYGDRDAAEEALAGICIFVDNLKTNPSLRAGLRDAVIARELAGEIRQSFSDAIQYAAGDDDKYEFARKVTVSKDVLTDIAMSMPSRKVAVAVRMVYYKNATHTWKVSDLRDIEALALAVPSCDVVVTDKEVCGALRQARFNEPEYATVLSNRRDLLDRLSGDER